MENASNTEDGGFVVTVPLVRVRHAFHTSVVVRGPGGETPEKSMYMPALLAFARARRWKTMLECGKIRDYLEISVRTGKDPSYIRKVMRLNFLSPKFVNALVENRRTDGISLERLFALNTPSWEEQEKKIGLKSPG